MCETNQEETLKTEHLVIALNRYGASDVLSLLVRFSDQDWAVKQLLIRFPSVVAISHFMFDKPLFEIKGISSEEFFKTSCPIKVSEEKGQNQRGEIGEKASTPKKRNRKLAQKSPAQGRKEPLERAGDKTSDPPDRGEDVMEKVTDDIKLDLGFSLLDRGEHGAAFALFSSLPWNSNAEAKCGGMGRALMGMGRYDEAKRILEYGLKKFLQSYALWTDMGILYDELGDYSSALKCFDAALRFNKGESSACLYNKALILIKMESYGNAVSILDYLIERFPEKPKHFVERAYCSLQMGYPQEALRYYQKAFQLYQKSPNVEVGVIIFSGLCCAYRELGMKKEALEISLDAFSKFQDSDPVLYHNLATCFYEFGWAADSRRLLEIAVEKFPDDEELKKFLSDVEADMDDPDGDIKPFLGLLLLALLSKKSKKKV